MFIITVNENVIITSITMMRRSPGSSSRRPRHCESGRGGCRPRGGDAVVVVVVVEEVVVVEGKLL